MWRSKVEGKLVNATSTECKMETAVRQSARVEKNSGGGFLIQLLLLKRQPYIRTFFPSLVIHRKGLLFQGNKLPILPLNKSI